jgi:type IV pilus assembly protein PilM
MQNVLDQMKTFIALGQKRINGLVSELQKKFGGGERSVIGLDIGTSSIKAVQMADRNGAMTIVKSAIIDIDGAPGDEQAVVNSLKAAVSGMTIAEARVVAVINCPETCTRKIITPNIPRKELADAVYWEAKNAIPYSIDEAGMDYKVFGEVLEKGGKKLAVIVATAPRETIQRCVSLCSQAGLELSALIPVSVSQQNLVGLSPDMRKETVAVVEMGAGVTELNIYAHGKLDFSRKLPVAGNDMTKSLTSTLMSQQGKIELTAAEAERIKKEKGIPGVDDTEMVAGKILASQILSLVRPGVEQLATEIDRSFDFYREGPVGGEKVVRIILLGGGANLKGLAEFLRAELDTEIIVGDCLKDVQAQSGALPGEGNAGTRFHLAIGAALDRAAGINLLPAELKEKTRRFIENISLQAVAAGMAAALVLLYIGLNIQTGSLNKKLEALRLEQRTAVAQLEAIRSAIWADRILMEHPYWEDVLKEISNTIGPGMYLTELNMKDDLVGLKGVIIEDDRRAQALLSDFMITLEEGIFRNVNLVTAQKESESSRVSEFEITTEID